MPDPGDGGGADGPGVGAFRAAIMKELRLGANLTAKQKRTIHTLITTVKWFIAIIFKTMAYGNQTLWNSVCIIRSYLLPKANRHVDLLSL
jgi:hypothetical protein